MTTDIREAYEHVFGMAFDPKARDTLSLDAPDPTPEQTEMMTQ